MWNTGLMSRSRWSATLWSACTLGCFTLFSWGTASAQEVNTLSESEARSGWKLLFDGKTTDGWRNYKKDGISAGWQVVDGVLTRSEKGAGDIVTAAQYESFQLSIEFNVSRGGNSGIMFHVAETGGAPWHTGPEIQINDHANGHDPVKAGWLYQLYKPTDDADAFRGHDQWNQLDLKVTPENCEINLNGVRYARFKKGSKDWDAKVAASKFASMAEFGKPTKGHICLQDHGDLVRFRNIKIRELPPTAPLTEPVTGELALKPVVAFPELTWTDWNSVNEQGKNVPLRPIVLTHAGDGSNRIFVATQQGVIHSFDNTDAPQATKVFLDIQSKVVYADNKNEEGLLGFAFHPKFKENGQVFVYYTTKDAPLTSVISRFTLAAGSKDRLDPASEVEIMRLEQPYWNHNGGTIAFGPDGYLYIGLGDGGAGNDPHKNAQNLGVLLGSILRIDIDHHDQGLAYAIPKDNPFVGREGARGEIYAYGVRNIWRLSFDRQTGHLWAADVGQNLWEEINIIVKGGNYGWNTMEGTHLFGDVPAGPHANPIAPVWEYDHEIGKSITGGYVYRGKKVPELFGKYLYADYVTGKLYALHYDEAAQKVLSNESIPSDKMPVISYGEDEAGEVYFMIVSPNGQGIHRFEKK
ncbi:MAG: PQQ-dependent sugar dehydrogenase [Planctomycetaceae bacterium]